MATIAVQAKRWRTKAVADAAEIPIETLFRHLDRRTITLDAGDLNPGSSGKPRMFGAPSIYRVAILHRLTRAGLPPAAAKKFADQFSDTGQAGRQPGALFPTGHTLMITSQDGGGKIINLPPESFIDDV